MTQRLVILIADLGVDERHRQPGERLGQAFRCRGEACGHL